LDERVLRLGTVEAGVEAAASHALFATDEGPIVLGNSLVVEDIEDAVEVLDLPERQFKTSGIVSAKAARAAARTARTMLGTDLCLVLWGEGPELKDSLLHPIHVALNYRDEITEVTYEPEGAKGSMEKLVQIAYQLVLEAL
jgi:nicotinamide mononucleotide (NMN) deamidase PncC